MQLRTTYMMMDGHIHRTESAMHKCFAARHVPDLVGTVACEEASLIGHTGLILSRPRFTETAL